MKIDAYNQVVTAALADGTIRWFRFRDGLPLLYLHPDQRRWVLWTPSGYFDCAPGAEELLGWHVNNCPDQAADYFPLSKFRSTYYRPDVIDLILETLDETEALHTANKTIGRSSLDLGNTTAVLAQLPPVVRIHRPTEGQEVQATSLPVEYSIESAGSEVTFLRLLVDGRPVSVERGFKPTGKALQAVINIPSTDCVVSVIAEKGGCAKHGRFGGRQNRGLYGCLSLRWPDARSRTTWPAARCDLGHQRVDFGGKRRRGVLLGHHPPIRARKPCLGQRRLYESPGGRTFRHSPDS